MRAIQTKRFFAALGLSATLVLAGGAQAGSVTYEIDVNTSNLSGEPGYLDFQFDPGNPPYDPGSATLTGFSTDGILTAAAPNIGDVTGSLPSTVTINNTNVTNDYSPGFIYGTFFDIFVDLNIPAVSGDATGGNSFTLDVEDSGFGSLFGTFPAVEIDLDPTTGNPSIINNSGGAATVTATPEPGSLLFLVTGLVGLAALTRFFSSISTLGLRPLSSRSQRTTNG